MGKLSRQRAAKEARAKLGKARPLETFFSSYTDSALNPEAPSGLEFQRLRKEQGWKRGDAVGEAAWQDFRSALVLRVQWNGAKGLARLADALCNSWHRRSG